MNTDEIRRRIDDITAQIEDLNDERDRLIDDLPKDHTPKTKLQTTVENYWKQKLMATIPQEHKGASK